MFKKVVVCLDGSSVAEQILPFVTEGAQRFNTKVILLQVLDVPATVAWIKDTPPDIDIVTEESKRKEEEARAYLQGIATSLRAKGIDVGEVILHNISIDEAILDYAAGNDVDTIAMTTHGRTGIMRAVLGSVADSVVRKSGLPTVLLRPRNAD
ncbi:MAG: universal stress protein [Dehalococcoidia bacterium]|nr:MAG: universal stress protein [Dehalococcoidia bacterium]